MGLAGSAWSQTVPPAQPKATPKKTARTVKIEARKARVRATLAQPSTPGTDTVTVAPKKARPTAKPGQRAGSAPTPPVRNI